MKDVYPFIKKILSTYFIFNFIQPFILEAFFNAKSFQLEYFLPTFMLPNCR